VSSTGVVLVTHLLIPLYVMSDIRTIKKKVLGDIKAFREKQKQKQSTTQQLQLASEFNAAKYLFTSWRVASLFPELPESQLVLQFSTPWPKKSFKIEKKKVTRTYERRYSFVLQALSRVLIFFVSGLIHLPAAVQDLVIQVGSNSGLGYVVLLMLQLYSVSPLLPLVPIVALGIIIHFLVLSNKNSALLERRQLEESTEPEPFVDISSPQPQPPSNDEEEPQIVWEDDDDEDLIALYGGASEQKSRLEEKSDGPSSSSSNIMWESESSDDQSVFWLEENIRAWRNVVNSVPAV
jgi:hypothetical protein